MQAKVKIFTDGACKGNPGVGGWGVLLQYKETEKVLYGSELHTTNNRMELTAAIKGLESLVRTCEVDLFTDSQYLRLGITTWITQWKKNDWCNKKRSAIKNKDLWQELDKLNHQHRITWHWVRGHSGHPENERADALANQAIFDLLNTPN